jgi:hypothetical protein
LGKPQQLLVVSGCLPLAAAAAAAPVAAGTIAVAAITAANATVHRCHCRPRWHAVALPPLLLLLSTVAAATAVTPVATQIILPHAKRGYWRFWAAISAGQFSRQQRNSNAGDGFLTLSDV